MIHNIILPEIYLSNKSTQSNLVYNIIFELKIIVNITFVEIIFNIGRISLV